RSKTSPASKLCSLGPTSEGVSSWPLSSAFSLASPRHKGRPGRDQTFLAFGFLGKRIGGFAMADTIHFNADPAGALPAEWTAGGAGRGSHRWSIEADTDAASKRNVLKQSGRGDFPWCVVRGASLADGFVEVRFKPISGAEDQAGGLVWR